jgi:aminoglycoside phosphotransferase (APT) family kinase protein
MVSNEDPSSTPPCGLEALDTSGVQLQSELPALAAGRPQVLVHGDLQPEHVIVDQAGRAIAG